MRRHIAFLPRDRKTEGIFGPLSVLDNVTVSCLRQLGRLGVLNPGRRYAVADARSKQAKVKMAGPHTLITSLSGGNQQKALLGRLLATKPKVLVLNDPMRGVDLGAKRDLYDVLSQLATEGIAVVLLSTELIELCLLCDRVVVFRDYALTVTIDQSELSERALIDAMFGQSQRTRATAGASA
jgi:ABC-type sugar transport system ATPase subunit